MNRRQFLRSLLAGVAATTLTDIDVDKLLLQTSHLSDEEFSSQIVYYIKLTFQMEIVNPSQCAYIDNIDE